MRIAVLGTGMVGRALAEGLAGLGHQVAIGTRDPQTSLGRTEADGFGTWIAGHQELAVDAFAAAADGAELVVNALNGQGSAEGIAAARVADGTVLLDVANPLDFSNVMPPTLFVSNTDSLAEQLQRTFPGLRVVKSLNTMTANLMVHPGQLDEFSTFVCGDDPDAKQLVNDLLVALGHRDVIDIGPLSSARGTESLMPLWLRLWGVVGSANFAFKVVR